MADSPTGEPPPGAEAPVFTPGTGSFLRRQGKKSVTGKKPRAVFVCDTAPAEIPQQEAAQFSSEEAGQNASLLSHDSQVSPRSGNVENVEGGDT